MRCAMSEAAMNGEITSIPRTKHGESRLPNVEKYDLPEAFRLVVQLVDGIKKTRAFLFIGTHDDAENWLDTHKNYKWVKSTTSGKLDFVLVTETTEDRYIPANRIDLETPEELLSKPLLRVLSKNEWASLKLTPAAQKLAETITEEDFECDADGLVQKLTELSDENQANTISDLLLHAHYGQWAELHQRVNVQTGSAIIAAQQEAASLMSSSKNSEQFVTFDDGELDTFFSKNTFADWMIFLHPEQKKVSDREFRGPARLRGISGSGKTCVLVHRARYLAKKYRSPILLVTLTESLRKLLEKLVSDLCGAEMTFINIKTMGSLAKETIINYQGKSSFSFISAEEQDNYIELSISEMRKLSDFSKSPLANMPPYLLKMFIQDEFSYIRGRLTPDQFNTYTDTQTFQRRGRVVPVGTTSRQVILHGLIFYHQKIKQSNQLDHEESVAYANVLLKSNILSGNFRCVLSDEVQDLSELDLNLLGNLKTQNGERMMSVENGLFLAGDGTQSIYKRGFALRRIGIDIVGRSVNLRKNYRNTFEILKAAFGLVAEHEFSDIDDDNISKPTMPEYAKRHGQRPLLVRCPTLAEEARFVAQSILSLINMGHTPGQICIIGPNRGVRELVFNELKNVNIQSSELRLDVDYESDNVKITTIESAKGHEFGSVYIMGLVNGLIPNKSLGEEELPREAARLYVAMTRARENLTLTYSPSPDYPVSQFLLDIQENCDEATVRNGELFKVKK